MTQDEDQGMSGRERAMHGLLKELARAGAGPDMSFLNRVMSRVHSTPGLASSSNWMQRASRWPGTWIIFGVLVVVNLMFVFGKPGLKQLPPIEAAGEIEGKREIVKASIIKDETLLYSATFSPELLDWVDAVSFQLNRRPNLPDGTEFTPSAISNKAKGNVLRSVVVRSRDREVNGMTIDCKHIDRDAIAGVVLNREFDEGHIEIEFDMRIKEFYRLGSSNWGYFGIGLNRDISAPPAKHHKRLSKNVELYRHLEKGNWSHYRVTLHRSISKDGVACTDFRQYYDNVLFHDDRIEMTGNRIVILQMGICTEITNFSVRRIGPPKASTTGDEF